ncbi:MAG: DUF3365 domain-containing protein [Myxococcales bacterium]|nr:DUF3365 domain-containing protein [Myxococcales bacterium]
MHRSLRPITATLMLLVACSKDSTTAASAPATEVGAAELARGKATIGELKRTLIAALTQAMATSVPAAIEVCQIQAPAIAAGLSGDGITVGRATRKPRNPANLAAGWQAEALTHFEELRTAGTKLAGTSFARRLADGRIAYAEPLMIQPVCLSCHGATLAPEVQQVIATRYPADRATGYAEGDLRGIAWVELPAVPRTGR